MVISYSFSLSPSSINNKNKVINHLAIALLLLLTLYCLYSSFNRGSANAWYFNAEFSLNDWAKKNTIKDKAEYTDTLTSINKAQALDSSHPHYAHMVGRIMHWGVDMGFEEKDKLTAIKQWYLLATELRPQWPDPWVDLMLLNNSSLGLNDETMYYLKQALETGLYTDEVTLGSLQLWLLHWSVLSGAERAEMFKQFDIATKQPKLLNKVLEFAKAINREKLLCSQLKFNPKYAKQKESYLYNRYCLK